jgi:RNA polymerase sigma factor (sigma-70 family)
MQRLTAAARLCSVVAVPDERAVPDGDASQLSASGLVERIHARHGQQLFGFVRRQGLDDEEAQEVVQEALLRLWRASSSEDRPSQPVAWAYRTAYRLAMDRHRVQRRWLAFLGRQVVRPVDPSSRADELAAVWTEVDRLPMRQRQVLYLRYRADLTFADIGVVLGIDVSTARSAGSRAIATLRDRLADEGE